ncbi:MAG: PAS domain-containing protein [Nitrospinae bacterium]|nr:PAS domain-containing protein [Nitrospinota bacterium]
MNDRERNKEQLLGDLAGLRSRIDELEAEKTAWLERQEALARSEECFRKIFNHSNDAIFVVDPEEDRILDANFKASEMLGYTCDELLSMPMSALHPGEMPAVLAFARNVHEQGSGWTNELTCLTKTGKKLATEMSASIIELGAGTHMIALIRDISDRKRAEDELRKSREQLQALADNLPEFISMKDSDGRFIFVNRRFEEWVCVDRNDVIGKSAHDIYPEEQATEFDALDREVLASGKVTTREVELSYPDGNTRTIIGIRFPVISSKGEVLGLGTVNHDITERKRAERELAAKEAQLRIALDNMPGGMRLVDKFVDGLPGPNQPKFLSRNLFDGKGVVFELIDPLEKFLVFLFVRGYFFRRGANLMLQ